MGRVPIQFDLRLKRCRVDVLMSRLCMVILLTLLITGCGFSARGALSPTDDSAEGFREANLGAIFIDAPGNVPIAALLERRIQDRDLSLTNDRNAASILVRLTDESVVRRILSVQSTGRVSEYELRHSVNLLVAKGIDGEVARYDPDQPPNRVTVLREYTYDNTGVLGKEDEASILREEMRDELARHLLLRLIATTRGTTTQ